VFEALSERQGQLRGLIENSDAVFATTARRNAELADTFEIFPTFLRESRATLARLETFARDSDPVVQQLRPAARELSPTFIALGELAPDLESFLRGFGRATGVAGSGFAALRGLLDDELPPLLQRLDPYMQQANSILEGVKRYRREITAFLGNVTAATNGFLGLSDDLVPLHNVRTSAPFSPEIFSAFPERLRFTRSNPYTKNGDYRPGALNVFNAASCAGGIEALLPDRTTTVNDPDFNVRTGGNITAAELLYDRILEFGFVGQADTDNVPTPPCPQQSNFQSIGVSPEETRYLHVREQP
jgi:phospholipid/cholesterol/gamma-HCH transport system substrate-binding protein